MSSDRRFSLLADAVDLVGRVDTTTAAKQIYLRPDANLEALSAARIEIHMMLEDLEEDWLSRDLRLADEALSIAERWRLEQ
ncbi:MULTISPECIES: hypothetical protein [Paenarthrobacter]|uniref:hypothetical protein n=1 Tax=Paenarthrobacter TaxID=1742992 RepID=UPI00074D343D|nr:hypothetical protein [Paenarthrobacter ureafaciens]AMB41651.1 hypothetical protein AUT26_16655 [Arthrobacter sp. ATCC 21022]KUR64493.1 hypothetical protein JM67_10715 [Arthrobacter sp. ATCC 21022]RWW94330.1 hypothetical protein AUR_06830 [Paenarthrobacter ureafaciens]GLU60761.1 hypothetical protein Pure01_32740 [Paenarthrobacter ureafaciens]GLU65031.1 hypothetical protein Pure02_32810 [Paenarthrobacter ureafaciens]